MIIHLSKQIGSRFLGIDLLATKSKHIVNYALAG
jgi:hypothetical protein